MPLPVIPRATPSCRGSLWVSHVSSEFVHPSPRSSWIAFAHARFDDALSQVAKPSAEWNSSAHL